MMKEKLIDLVSDSIRKNWEITAMTNYQGESIRYGEIGAKISRLHIVFECCNVKSGDKIAVIGKNSINWAITYLATLTYGAVIVPVLPDFKPADIHHIVNHSDASMIFVADTIFENMDAHRMPKVKSGFSLTDFSLIFSAQSKKTGQVLGNLNALIKRNTPVVSNPPL